MNRGFFFNHGSFNIGGLQCLETPGSNIYYRRFLVLEHRKVFGTRQGYKIVRCFRHLLILMPFQSQQNLLELSARELIFHLNKREGFSVY
jgi:hypothetical protein